MTIKDLLKNIPLLIAFTLFFSLTACGGGGGGEGTTAQKVTVTLGLQGSAATIVGAVDIDVVLPDGFVLETDSATGLPIDTALTFLVPSATFESNYIPATATANGLIKAGIFKTDGFAGNASLVQVSRTYAAGATLPSAEDFMVTVIASDLNGATLTGISEQINVTVQADL